MDKMWKKHNIDLQLRPYNVIATGAETGMIEVVTSSNTVSKIQKVCDFSKFRSFVHVIFLLFVFRAPHGSVIFFLCGVSTL